MSYIVLGTGHYDPPLSITNMDLEDLKYIYKNRITNYLNSCEQASLYYYQTQDIPKLEIIYDINTIINKICYQYDNNNQILSVVPLFFYLSCKTDNWTKSINFESVISEYIKKAKETEDITEFLINAGKETDFSYFPCLTLFQELQQTTGLNYSIFFNFLNFWNADCLFVIEIPNKEISVALFSGLSENQKKNAETIQQLITYNPDNYILYSDGSLYDKSIKKWIVGGKNHAQQ